MDKILLIDAHNFIWRGFVFFKAQEGPKENIMAFNFFRNLRSIVEQFKPNKIFMVWEGHPKFRYDLYPEYKANRIIKTASKQENNDIFLKSKNIIENVLRYFPITFARANAYEADDVISSLCEQMKDEELIVLSSDSDYTQLLQKDYNIKVYNPIKKEFVVAPKYPYVVWKSLAGDKSDNINKLLTPKKVELLLSNPNKLSEFLDLEENRANFSINKQLIEFASVPDDEIIIENGLNDFNKVKMEFISLEFSSILLSWNKYVETFNCVNL